MIKNVSNDVNEEGGSEVNSDEDDNGVDEDCDDDNEDGDIVEESYSVENVPESCFFHSFFAFFLWGPFADENKQLPMLAVDDAKSEHAKSQAQLRAAKRLKKMDERANDTAESRGFSTDQRTLNQ